MAGTTALVARNWGAKNYDNASQFIVTTVQLVLVLSVVTSIFVHRYAYDISFFFALRGDALTYSSEYLRVLSPYFIFYGLGIARDLRGQAGRGRTGAAIGAGAGTLLGLIQSMNSDEPQYYPYP